MSRTIRNKKQSRSTCNCDRCRDGRQYGDKKRDKEAKEAIKETRRDRESD